MGPILLGQRGSQISEDLCAVQALAESEDRCSLLLFGEDRLDFGGGLLQCIFNAGLTG